MADTKDDVKKRVESKNSDGRKADDRMEDQVKQKSQNKNGIPSSSGLSLTAQLRQIKHLPKARSLSSGDVRKPDNLSGKPSLNQFSVKPSTILNEMPSSFNDLIAATGNSPNPQPIASTNPSISLSQSPPETTSLSTQTTPLTGTIAAAFVQQQKMLDTNKVILPTSPEEAGSTPSPLPKSMTSTAGPPPPSGKPTPPKNPSNDSSRRRRTRCKKCEACVRSDCGKCHFCTDMKKFGGPGRMKQSCITRQCMSPVLPHTACCMICGRDGWEKISVPGLIGLDDTQSSLMECSQCWEIVHPVCLKEKNPGIDLETGKRDDLPNSWECPKCVIALKTASAKMKGFPKSAVSNNSVKNDSTEASESVTPKADGLLTAIKKDVSMVVIVSSDDEPSPTKASSCQPSKKIEAVTATIDSKSESSQSSSSSERMKRPAESLKDKLFRSLKTFKKNSGAKSSVSKTCMVNSPASLISEHDEGSNSSNVLIESSKPKSKPHQPKVESPIKSEEDDDESDGTDTNDVSEGESTQNSDLQPQEFLSLNGRPLIQPLYVVRPAPIPDDYSESDDGGNDDEDEEDDSSEDEDEMEKRRIIRKHLRKFRRPRNKNLALERDVIFPTLKFLTRKDVLSCSLVCKPWNAWSSDPSLWPSLNYSGKKITPAILIGIVKRQPRVLDLSWTNLSQKQLQWLLPRIPQLQNLLLTGCSASTVSALTTSNCPLLKSLDVSFVDSLNDELLRDLLSSPPDQRPGLLDTRTRLRLLQELCIAGSDVTDEGVGVICSSCPFLTRIDLSNCLHISDIGIVCLIGSTKTSRLTSIKLFGCPGITENCLESLRRCSNLVELDMRSCDEVSIPAFAKIFHFQAKKHAIELVQSKHFLSKN